MSCGQPVCRCEERERVRAEPVQVYDCPACAEGGFAIGPATLAALKVVKHPSLLVLDGDVLLCAKCRTPMRNQNDLPCGACCKCWTTDAAAGVRFLYAFGARGQTVCVRCEPLRWYERLPDGRGPQKPGEDMGPRLCALFDELMALRAQRTRGAA